MSRKNRDQVSAVGDRKSEAERRTKDEGRRMAEGRGPRLNSLRSFSSKNLTGQAEGGKQDREKRIEERGNRKKEDGGQRTED